MTNKVDPSAVLPQLAHSDRSVRLGVLDSIGLPELKTIPGICNAIWNQLGVEEDPEARRAQLRTISQLDPTGFSPLNEFLESGHGTVRRGAAKSLEWVLADPASFAVVFRALAGPHCRALAWILNDLAGLQPDATSTSLQSCLRSTSPEIQQIGLIALLEVPEVMAAPLFGEITEKNCHVDAAERLREVAAIIELRRLFREETLPYLPLRCLGQGGFGSVYLCRDLRRPPRLAALKILLPATNGYPDPDALVRFEREARVPLLFHHPGLMRIFDFGLQAKLPWIDCDFIQGESLHDLLRRERTIPWEKALWIARQVADALDYLHRRKVIHRDVKPANLFLARDPQRVYLGDFGLVLIEDDLLRQEIPNYAATRTHVIMGTLGYMPIEQCLQDIVDQRGDLFSLGVILYQMLSGSLPYPARSLSEYVGALTSGRPPPSLERLLPPQVWSLLRSLLAPSAADRFPSAAAFLEALERVPKNPEPMRPQFGAPATGRSDLTVATPTDGRAAGEKTEDDIVYLHLQEWTDAVSEVPAAAASPKSGIDSGDSRSASSPGSVPNSLTSTEFRNRTPLVSESILPAFAANRSGITARPPAPIPAMEPVVAAPVPWAPTGPSPGKAAPTFGGTTPAMGPAAGEPELCPHCRRVRVRDPRGCRSCQLSLMPWTPWLLAWGFAGVAIALVVSAIFPQLVKSVTSLSVESPEKAVVLAVALLLTAHGIRRSETWAYLLALGLTVVASVGLVTVAATVHGLKFSSLPENFQQNFPQLLVFPRWICAHLEPGRIGWLQRDWIGSVTVIAVLSALTPMILITRDIRNHFWGPWTWSSVVLGALSVGLLVAAVLV